MNANQLIIIAAVAIALGAWGLCQLVIWLLDGTKQKLQQRLASDGAQAGAAQNRSIKLDPRAMVLPPLLARSGFMQGLNLKLFYAYPEAKLTNFLLIVFGVAAASSVMTAALMNSLLAGGVAGAMGAYLPFIVLGNKRSRRQRQLANQLPEALDFLSRVLKAGHSLSTGLQMMGDELPQPIGAEFRRCYGQHSLGQSLEDAMRDMARRVDSTDFAFFVTAVLIQRQTGGDLSEVLGNIANMVRSRIRLQQHVKAITAEGRFTGYILVAFPFILFIVSYVLNPAYAGILLNTDTGKMLLGTAVGLQVLGLLAIRKIVTVNV